MSLELERSGVLVRQVLLSGEVVDTLGGAPLAPAEVDVADRDTNERMDFVTRVFSDGTFAVSARPELAFPKLASRDYHLRLEVSASGYQPTDHEITIPRTSNQPTETPFSVPAGDIPDGEYTHFDHANLPVDGISIVLERVPVELAGRVTDPSGQPVDAATVEVASFRTHTNARGEFDIASALPVQKEVSYKVQKTGYETLSDTHTLDYTTSTNRLSLQLKPNP